MTHSYRCHDSFICSHARWLLPLIHDALCVCHDSFTCLPWLIHMCAMTHLYVRHDSVMCVPWRIHRQKSYCVHSTRIHIASYMWHDPYVCVTWLGHVCDMTHSYVWREPLICVPRLIHRGDTLIHTCPVTRSHRDSCIHCVPRLMHTVCAVTHSRVR